MVHTVNEHLWLIKVLALKWIYVTFGFSTLKCLKFMFVGLVYSHLTSILYAYFQLHSYIAYFVPTFSGSMLHA